VSANTVPIVLTQCTAEQTKHQNLNMRFCLRTH